VKLNKSAIDKIRKKYNLVLILLHGSQVSGKTHSASDIDIAVLPKPGVSFDLLNLYTDLGKVIKPADKLDITNLANADPLLLFTVTTESKLISGSGKIYTSLKLTAFKKYNNYLPYLEMEKKVTLTNLNKYVAG